MLALGYLVLMVLVGDIVARPLLAPLGWRGAGTTSRARRLATSFLVGLLVMTWSTYLVALAAQGTVAPLEVGQAVTMLGGLALVAARLGLAARRSGLVLPSWLTARPDRPELLDWLLIAALTLFVGWMAAATYQFQDGELRMATFVWSDFGPTSAIAQSFALGNNFPTEYPHFAGPPILYHFLFYFQVGNLTRLGLDPALATNVLSVASLVAMLVLVMTLGRVLFRSAVVGRIAALLFFFHGSLAFLPYLSSFASPSEALATIGARTAFLPSGFPYRGEEWGIWTQAAFLNQRHLASAIGILLIGVVFVIERARGGSAIQSADLEPGRPDPTDSEPVAPGPAATPLASPASRIRARLAAPDLAGYAVVGLLLGLLPWWNSALFTASAVVFAVLFLALPNRWPMIVTGAVAGLLALPQVLALRPADLPRTGEYPVIHLGYVVENPTVLAVVTYLAITFGPKVLLAGLAAALGTFRQLAVLLAFSSLVVVAFTVQFSTEVFANHKFLNVWLVVLNVYAAGGLVLLWEEVGGAIRPLAQVAGRSLAIVLVGAIATGGLIDLAPIRNAQLLTFPMAGDPLFDWVRRETKPSDVFLTDLHVTDAFLLAGRKLYHGWPYYAWSAGYPVREREDLYREMLGGTDADKVTRLLQQEHIAYVAVDDGMRTRGFVPQLNESLLGQTFEQVFEDPAGRYGHMAIYRVPSDPVSASVGGAGASAPASPRAPVGPTPTPPPAVDLFTGGPGSGPGRLAHPRGIAVASNGDVLLADTENHRIQRFSASGTWLAETGGQGAQPGSYNQPNGVAVDSQGRIYVADTANHRLQELDADFHFAREWRGPDPSFYGPRDVAVGPGDVIYILDQGRARVVQSAPDGSVRTFGVLGSGPGQLNEPTGIAIAGDRVFVADAGNARVAVFDTAGRFVGTLPIPEWQGVRLNYADVAVGPGGTVYVSSMATNQVLALDQSGRRLGVLDAGASGPLDGPGALAVRPDGGVLVVNFHGARVALLGPLG